MEIATTEIGRAAARVVLVGRFDAAGAEVAAPPLARLASTKQGLIIDMSEVSFIASFGIRPSGVCCEGAIAARRPACVAQSKRSGGGGA
jgi:hypothetical protein